MCCCLLYSLQQNLTSDCKFSFRSSAVQEVAVSVTFWVSDKSMWSGSVSLKCTFGFLSRRSSILTPFSTPLDDRGDIREVLKLGKFSASMDSTLEEVTMRLRSLLLDDCSTVFAGANGGFAFVVGSSFATLALTLHAMFSRPLSLVVDCEILFFWASISPLADFDFLKDAVSFWELLWGSFWKSWRKQHKTE